MQHQATQIMQKQFVEIRMYIAIVSHVTISDKYNTLLRERELPSTRNTECSQHMFDPSVNTNLMRVLTTGTDFVACIQVGKARIHIPGECTATHGPIFVPPCLHANFILQ